MRKTIRHRTRLSARAMPVFKFEIGSLIEIYLEVCSYWSLKTEDYFWVWQSTFIWNGEIMDDHQRLLPPVTKWRTKLSECKFQQQWVTQFKWVIIASKTVYGVNMHLCYPITQMSSKRKRANDVVFPSVVLIRHKGRVTLCTVCGRA